MTDSSGSQSRDHVSRILSGRFGQISRNFIENILWTEERLFLVYTQERPSSVIQSAFVVFKKL